MKQEKICKESENSKNWEVALIIFGWVPFLSKLSLDVKIANTSNYSKFQEQ